MNLGINFFLDSRFLINFSTFSLVQACTSSYKSKKVSGRFPDVIPYWQYTTFPNFIIKSCFGALPSLLVTIPAVTPTFSLTSRPAASPEAPCDTSSSHVPLRSHVIHPHAPSCTIPRDPISRPRWVRL